MWNEMNIHFVIDSSTARLELISMIVSDKNCNDPVPDKGVPQSPKEISTVETTTLNFLSF
jgi:hypothetical protein